MKTTPVTISSSSCGCFLLFGIIIGAICWPYTLNTWLVISGKPAAVTWWQGALMSIVPGIGHLGLPASVITWIATLFL